jgi:hypothetical protein
MRWCRHHVVYIDTGGGCVVGRRYVVCAFVEDEICAAAKVCEEMPIPM